MSQPAAAPRPDTDDMFAVHGVFRDCLGAAPTLVGSIAPGDTERVALIANYYENILSFLQSHHDGEEKLVFPLLRERCAGNDASIDHMDEQHHEALALMGDAKSSLAAWPGGDAAAQQAAQDRLGELCSHLDEHLSEESRRCCPWRASTSPWRSGGRSRHTAWPTSTATRSGSSSASSASA